MKIVKILLVSLLTVLMLSVSMTAQEMSKEDQEMMKKWQEYATPGAAHKYMEQFTGKWTTSNKMWMKPGAPPMTATGTAEAKMILGGRYLKSYYKGKMMGMDFEGIGKLGFNNMHKTYNSFWIDNTGTGFYLTEGKLSKDGKVRTEKGVWDDPMTGGKTKVKMVIYSVSGDSYKMEMYAEMPDGKEFKSMEMIYTKVK